MKTTPGPISIGSLFHNTSIITMKAVPCNLNHTHSHILEMCKKNYCSSRSVWCRLEKRDLQAPTQRVLQVKTSTLALRLIYCRTEDDGLEVWEKNMNTICPYHKCANFLCVKCVFLLGSWSFDFSVLSRREKLVLYWRLEKSPFFLSLAENKCFVCWRLIINNGRLLFN